MKREIVEYINECDTHKCVKAEHRCPPGELQPLQIPKLKWYSISMDFIVGLSRTPGG